jgi:putative membrane protein
MTRLALILAGIALLAGLAAWAGLPAIAHSFAAVGAEGFGAILLVHVPIILLLSAAWWSIGQPSVGVSFFVAARLARDAVAELLPFSQVGGFAAGVHVLSLTGVPARTGALSLLADLLMEFCAKLPYALAGLALLLSLRPASSLPFYLLLTIAVLVGLPLLLLLLRGLLAHWAARLMERWRQPDSEGLRSLLALEGLAPSGLLHILCWALGGVEAWVTLRLMGLPVTVLEALAIDSLVTSLRTFGFFVPAALGVQEAAYVLVCGLFGLSPGEAMAFSLVRRARDILFGLAGLGLWQHLEVRRARRPASGFKTATGR